MPTPLEAAILAAAPQASLAIWKEPLRVAFIHWELGTGMRVCAALGQFAVEAGPDFGELVENLNYTHAARIAAVWPRHFPTADAAQAYVGHPEMLANRVYANELGNGNAASGDGWRFRGRGLIQLTGRDEYSEFAETMGTTPEAASAYLETPEGAAMSGAWYLASRGCLSLADVWRLSAITQKVNGAALEGLGARITASNAALRAWNGAS
jgi:predicted chitinase